MLNDTSSTPSGCQLEVDLDTKTHQQCLLDPLRTLEGELLQALDTFDLVQASIIPPK